MFNKGGNSVKIQAQIESLVLESAKGIIFFTFGIIAMVQR